MWGGEWEAVLAGLSRGCWLVPNAKLWTDGEAAGGEGEAVSDGFSMGRCMLPGVHGAGTTGERDPRC